MIHIMKMSGYPSQVVSKLLWEYLLEVEMEFGNKQFVLFLSEITDHGSWSPHWRAFQEELTGHEVIII